MIDRERVWRKDKCIHFEERRVSSEIYGKSPFFRGNILWKQLDSTIQQAKYKVEFDRMLTNDIIHHLKMYKFNAHCAVLTFSYLYILYLLIYSS